MSYQEEDRSGFESGLPSTPVKSGGTASNEAPVLQTTPKMENGDLILDNVSSLSVRYISDDSDGDLEKPTRNINKPASWAKDSPIQITRSPVTVVDLSDIAKDPTKMAVLSAHAPWSDKNPSLPRCLHEAAVVPLNLVNRKDKPMQDSSSGPVHVILEYDSSFNGELHADPNKF
jgi:hypothetical protein